MTLRGKMDNYGPSKSHKSMINENTLSIQWWHIWGMTCTQLNNTTNNLKWKGILQFLLAKWLKCRHTEETISDKISL